MVKSVLNNKKNLYLVSAMAITILFPVYMSDETLTFSNSIYPFLFLWSIYTLLNYSDGVRNLSTRIKKCAYVLGTLYAIMMSWGRSLSVYGAIDFINSKKICSIILFSFLCGRIILILWSKIEALNKADDRSSHARVWNVYNYVMMHPMLIGGILLLCWLPCYLSTFPGGFRYDATGEYNQITYGYRGDYPLLHSFIVTQIISKFFEWTGDYNVGIATYTIIQMILFALMYAQMLHEFYKMGINKIVVTVIMLYCAFFPVVPMLTTQMLRDVMFSGLLVYTVFLLFLMSRNVSDFFKSRQKPVLLGIMITLTLLSRNNNTGWGVMAVVVVLSLVLWILSRRVNFRRGVNLFLVSLVISYVGISIFLTNMCQPFIPPTKGASLSVFSQSLVRTYVQNGQEWSEEERNKLATFMDLGEIEYVPENADPTKSAIYNEMNMGEFLSFWVQIGAKYPHSYLNAILANTHQVWDPGVVVDGYNKADVSSYDSYEKCYYSFSSNISEPGTMICLAPRVHEFYKNIGLFLSFEKVPLISMLFSIGFQVWLLLFCMFQTIAYKNKKVYLPLTVLVVYTLLSAFVPLVLLRYFAALFFAFPLILVFILCHNKIQGNPEGQ